MFNRTTMSEKSSGTGENWFIRTGERLNKITLGLGVAAGVGVVAVSAAGVAVPLAVQTGLGTAIGLDVAGNEGWRRLRRQ